MPEPWAIPEPVSAQPVRPPEPDYDLYDAPSRDRDRMHRHWHEDHPWRPCERPEQGIEQPGWRNTIRRFLRFG